MTALLASVRSIEEALDAARAGADLIDLKEPHAGALGGVEVNEIARIVRRLRAEYATRPISATIGDLPDHALDEMTTRVLDVAAAGVDYVKVGISTEAALKHLSGVPAVTVPVLLSDRGIDHKLALMTAELRFPAIVFDTALKDGRTLFDCVSFEALRECVRELRASGMMTGIAGSLGWNDRDSIRAIVPDFAGFRGALCSGHAGRHDRKGKLDPSLVSRWAHALHSNSEIEQPIPHD